MRVLFVGNSYTYVNDLPAVVHALGAATPGAAVDVDSVTAGGAGLMNHWEMGDARVKIMSGDFDAVVLQGQSLEALPGIGYDYFSPYASLFAGAARAADTRVVWYATWARQAGEQTYESLQTTPDFMMRAIDHTYRHAAEQWGGTVARAGAAWQLAIAEQPTVNLYADDGSHPSPAGTLLTACTMFLALTGKEAVLPDPVPFGIDRGTATALCALAPRVRCDTGDCVCSKAEQVATTYTYIEPLSQACDGLSQRRGLDCNQAMNTMCEMTRCMNAGFGHGALSDIPNALSLLADLTCVSGTPLDTTYTALRALEPSCDGAAQRYGAGCATAIHRACAATGALSGFGPTSVTGDAVKATCVQSKDAMTQHLEWSRLAGYDVQCNGTDERWGDHCDVAIDEFCHRQGFAGGFGPTETTGTHADFVCVAW
jgi:hypothetical protein